MPCPDDCDLAKDPGIDWNQAQSLHRLRATEFISLRFQGERQGFTAGEDETEPTEIIKQSSVYESIPVKQNC
jgi:hypothetical protein